MGRQRSAGFDDHRKDILDTAAALFAQRGYLGTTVNEVAEACGITKPTLYHYYRDKNALLMHIADGHVTALVDLTQEVERKHEPGQPRLHALVHRLLAEYAGARNKHRVLTEDVKYLSPEDLSIVIGKERQVVKAFTDALAQARPDIERQGLAKPVAMLLFGMINWLFTWWQPTGRLRLDELARLVEQFLAGGLAAIEPQSVMPRGVAKSEQVGTRDRVSRSKSKSAVA